MENKTKIKVSLPDGEIIERVPNIEMCGNFQVLWIRYNNKKYVVGDGDEYLRGYPPVFALGNEIK